MKALQFLILLFTMQCAIASTTDDSNDVSMSEIVKAGAKLKVSKNAKFLNFEIDMNKFGLCQIEQMDLQTFEIGGHLLTSTPVKTLEDRYSFIVHETYLGNIMLNLECSKGEYNFLRIYLSSYEYQ